MRYVSVSSADEDPLKEVLHRDANALLLFQYPLRMKTL